jgi:hypothetical protein
LEGVGPENRDFFGPKWHDAPRNDVALLKIHYVLRHKNNRYINSYYLSTKLSRQEMLQNCIIMLISTPAEIRALFRKRKLAILHKMFYLMQS